MKNLKLIQKYKTVFQNEISEEAFPFFVVDPVSNYYYFLTTDLKLWCVDLFGEQLEEVSDLIKEEALEKGDEFIALEFIPDLECVCMATKQGDLIIYDIPSKEIESVGSVDTGFSSMKWSPDYEVVILITRNNTILQMTKDWEILVEVTLLQNGQDQENIISDISWRPDGNFFTVLCIDSSKKKTIECFDRSCVRTSSTDQTSFPDSAEIAENISWKPSSNLIATPIKSHKLEIVFFERNGLRHGEFNINDCDQILDLKWNSEGDILAIVTQTENNFSVEFWHSSNYHWFLKQKYNFKTKISISWDPEDPMSCRISSITKTSAWISEYHFVWEYNVSNSFEENNLSISGVIDGNSLGLTPLKMMSCPPPMSATFLKISDFEKILNFSIEESKNSKILIHTNNNFFHFFNNYQVILLEEPLFIDEKTIFAIQNNENEKTDSLIYFEINFKNEEVEIEKITSISCQEKILRLYHSSKTNTIYIQDNLGQIYILNLENLKLEIQDIKFVTPCQWISSVTIKNQSDDFVETLVGRNFRNRLFLGNDILSTQCNSFSSHDRFLVFTTLEHQLRCLNLSEKIENFEIDSKQISSKYDSSMRELERGSKLVTAIPNDTKVILQLPRGNLEIIYPRSLTVNLIREKLDKKQFSNAFQDMRKHRIDMNLFYDHNPNNFLNNVQIFVEQIPEVDFQNLFLSSLQNIDVTKTLFISSEKNKDNSFQISNENEKNEDDQKINKICDSLYQVYNNLDREKFLLSILFTFIKKTPPQIEKSLSLIRELREKEGNGNLMNEKQLAAETALDYIIFLIDVDKLFDYALGMYDFELVLMVAQKSQKDPKEYLQFLEELKNETKYYQRYLIDCYLERWGKALFNLCLSGKKYEPYAIDFIKKHKLYKEAISIFDSKKENLYGEIEEDTALFENFLPKIQYAYAEYLTQTSKFEEAGILFLNCGEKEQALNSLKMSSNWRLTFSIGCQILSDEQIVSLGESVSETLKQMRYFQDAAIVALDYTNNVEEAVSILCEGALWEDALRLIHKNKQLDLIDTYVLPGIEDSFFQQNRRITKHNQKYLKHFTRLKIVRNTKLESDKPMFWEDGFVDDTLSEFSEASTASWQSSSSWGSLATTASRQKLKKQKKKPRKRVTGKEGSTHEEEYLVTQLKNHLPDSKFQNDILNLTKILLFFNQQENAETIQNNFQNFKNLVESSLPLISASLTCVKLQDKEELDENILKFLPNKENIKWIPVSQIEVEKTDWQFDI